MLEVATFGVDIAKNVFQVHGADRTGAAVIRKRLRRSEVLSFFATVQPCLIGLEACSTSHYWGRELANLGHDVRLIPPAYVKPYLKRGKSDALDAEAICEAVTRPTMRFVPLKTPEQQSALVLHRTRGLLVRQRTMLVNALRAHLAEFGVVVPKGIQRVADLMQLVLEPEDEGCSLPLLVRASITAIASHLEGLQAQIETIEKEMRAWHRSNQASRRLATIPGVGFITATALAASLPNPSYFQSGRAMASWLGLTPRLRSSGEKERLGRISKAGDRYLRTLLVTGATAVIRSARLKYAGKLFDWVRKLLEKKPARLVTVALANKMARIAWAVLTRGEVFKNEALPA